MNTFIKIILGAIVSLGLAGGLMLAGDKYFSEKEIEVSEIKTNFMKPILIQTYNGNTLYGQIEVFQLESVESRYKAEDITFCILHYSMPTDVKCYFDTGEIIKSGELETRKVELLSLTKMNDA